ncbi:Fe2+-dependent dioxygenase [Limibacillus sp. MBR-115]|jgi:PKHD-type hydroxylase|uniref:Fe2+-dependent dioxygenase n=1 Tax=Limibacillus sp. MBR-115 TaxID=3156465 RepID=UPI00339B7B2E
MILQLGEVVSAPVLGALQAVMAKLEMFEDGAKTAGWRARERKNNLQAGRTSLASGAVKKVEKALLANTLFQSAARPKEIVRTLLSRYEVGMHYGAHVDDAVMAGRRTDLSFTLFLADPESYDGGALVIDRTEGERAFKLPAGHLLLYPSTTLHRVEPVTRGSRLAAVGWVRSLIRDDAQRELLFDLDRAAVLLRSEAGRDAAIDLVLKTRSNLIRRWVDD